jgi:phosphopentomutase
LVTNFIDFDTLYGHRRDVTGYAAALERFDRRLPELLDILKPEDLLVITADHGCDPTWHGTDHTREQIPILTYARNLAPRSLGKFGSFSFVSDMLSTHLELPLAN